MAASLQAIASEVADYSKEAFETTAAATEKLFGAKSLEKAIEVLLAQMDGRIAPPRKPGQEKKADSSSGK